MALNRKMVLIVAAFILVAVLVICVRYRPAASMRPAPDSAGARVPQLRAVAPKLRERLAVQIERLKRESTAESLKKLSDVNLFYWPGPIAGWEAFVVKQLVPLPEDAGHADLEAIMSNRRFRKLMQELATMDKATASRMVGSELSVGLSEYLKLYDAEIQRFFSKFRSSDTSGLRSGVGPTFAIQTGSEGKVVIAGARLKVLALVWTSGMLGLSDNRAKIEEVARLAFKQRTELYDDPKLDPFFKAEWLRGASLYNREILCSALLGTSGAELQPSLAKAAGVKWQEQRLASYESELTEFDLPVRSGVMKPDYSRGSLTVKFVSPLDDARFDSLLRTLSRVP